MGKNIGLLLVVLGVALSATFGSQLSPPEEEAARAEGAAVLSGAEAPEAARVGPGERLSSWFGVAGLPFSLGVVLVVAGASLARVSARRELTGDAPDSAASGDAVDFGALLTDLTQEVGALQEHMASGPNGDLTWEAVQAAIEEAQKGHLERLIEAGPRLQARHGLQAHAEIYAPLATAERRLNRAWSATVDRHWPEATDSVQHAHAALQAASEALAAHVPAA